MLVWVLFLLEWLGWFYFSRVCRQVVLVLMLMRCALLVSMIVQLDDLFLIGVSCLRCEKWLFSRLCSRRLYGS